MEPQAWMQELETLRAEKLRLVVEPGRPTSGQTGGDARALLTIALANEVNVSDLVALWAPTTPELEVKLAFARQAGDEANHYLLVAERMKALGFDPDGFAMPKPSPLFLFLRSLSGTVDRIAAGLFALESIAYGVNENFIRWCEQRGDRETARIYAEYIQPDERAHQELGRKLLLKYATTAELQSRAEQAMTTTFEIASQARSSTAQKIGVAAFPGC